MCYLSVKGKPNLEDMSDNEEKYRQQWHHSDMIQETWKECCRQYILFVNEPLVVQLCVCVVRNEKVKCNRQVIMSMHNCHFSIKFV